MRRTRIANEVDDYEEATDFAIMGGHRYGCWGGYRGGMLVAGAATVAAGTADKGDQAVQKPMIKLDVVTLIEASLFAASLISGAASIISATMAADRPSAKVQDHPRPSNDQVCLDHDKDGEVLCCDKWAVGCMTVQPIAGKWQPDLSPKK